MVTGGDDSVPDEAMEERDDELVTDGEQVTLSLVTNFASAPVGCDELLPCVIGAWSAALATPGGERIKVRGRFSMIARISGCRDKVPVEGEVRATVVAGGVRAAFLTNAAKCPKGDDSVRPTAVVAMIVGAVMVEMVPSAEGPMVIGVVEMALMTGSVGTTTGGMGSGRPRGGAKGSNGRVGRGTFQSALRKLKGGRVSGAVGSNPSGSGMPGGGGTPGGGGGTASIPGGRTGSGHREVAGTGGGSGTTCDCSNSRIPARQAGS